MTALTNHTIDTISCNGYGRCEAVPVWISAAHEGRRVIFFPLFVMDKKNAASAAHTPGPWTWSWTPKNQGSWTIYALDKFTKHDCGGNPIANVCYGEHSERFSNTRLIAVAPRFLQLAEELVERWSNYVDDPDRIALERWADHVSDWRMTINNAHGR